MNSKGKFERNVEIFIHICIWTYIFASPLMMRHHEETIDWLGYFRRLYFPFSSCLLFYLNYFYLVPRFVLGHKKYVTFALYNLALILALQFSQSLYAYLLPPLHELAPHFRQRVEPSLFSKTIFTIRTFVSLGFMSLMAVAIKLSMQWRKAEVARQEAELGRSEAELQNLKNQINPHFLLNTLNNIYSLTAFDPEAAQQAIQQLSSLLRYILYENQDPFVSLQKEADFLRTYVQLMRMRLGSHVSVEVETDIPEDDVCRVAPLIFISLVENAFKHGVSPTQPSFVKISLRADAEFIRFECTNSYFPKTSADKAPGGIGLKQVSKRLALTYPGKYIWQQGLEADGKTYRSMIYIAQHELINELDNVEIA